MAAVPENRNVVFLKVDVDEAAVSLHGRCFYLLDE